MAFIVNRRIGLGDGEHFLAIRCEIVDVTGYTTFLNLAIRRLDKAEIIDPRKSRERSDQPDVGTFGRFDRTDTSIVRRMHVADFEPGTIARKTTWPQRRQTPLVGQF